MENGDSLTRDEFERRYNDDMATVLTVLQQGLASPEHASFVEQLKNKTEIEKN